MTGRDRWLADRRSEARAFGTRHREDLVTRYMADRKLCDRPLLKVGDRRVHRRRPRRSPVEESFCHWTDLRRPRRFAVASRSRSIAASNLMPRVKDAEGVEYLTKWHESVHVACDFDGESAGPREQDCLPGFEVEVPTLIVCRGTEASTGQDVGREFFAENAALAAAVAPTRSRAVCSIPPAAAPSARGWRPG